VALAQAVEGTTIQTSAPAARVPVSQPVVRNVEQSAPKKSTPAVKLQVEKPVEAAKQPEKVAEQESAKGKPSTDGAAVSVQKIIENWAAVRVEVKKVSAQTEALLNSQRSLQIKDSTLLIGFASEFLRSKMDSSESLSITRDAIYKVTGAMLEVKPVVVGKKSGSATDNLDIEADGIVGTALNLGGKLIHRE
jgi:DNA polymerase-3 subunit gamma/tau